MCRFSLVIMYCFSLVTIYVFCFGFFCWSVSMCFVWGFFVGQYLCVLFWGFSLVSIYVFCFGFFHWSVSMCLFWGFSLVSIFVFVLGFSVGQYLCVLGFFIGQYQCVWVLSLVIMYHFCFRFRAFIPHIPFDLVQV